MARTVECVVCKKMFAPQGIKSHVQNAHGNVAASMSSDASSSPPSGSSDATPSGSPPPPTPSASVATPSGAKGAGYFFA